MGTQTAPPPDPDGPHTKKPTDQDRCVVVGRTLTGDTCTLILIRDRKGGGVVLYPYGMAQMGVRISAEDNLAVGRYLLNLDESA